MELSLFRKLFSRVPGSGARSPESCLIAGFGNAGLAGLAPCLLDGLGVARERSLAGKPPAVADVNDLSLAGRTSSRIIGQPTSAGRGPNPAYRGSTPVRRTPAVALESGPAATRRSTRSGSRSRAVDWDVHHGNGTQEMFWKSRRAASGSAPAVPQGTSRRCARWPTQGRAGAEGRPWSRRRRDATRSARLGAVGDVAGSMAA